MSTQPAAAPSPDVTARTAASVSESLLDWVLEQPVEQPAQATGGSPAHEVVHPDGPTSTLGQFLGAATVGEALTRWLGESWRDNESLTRPAQVATRLNADIAAIDGLLNDQVNAILHHARFQQLESSWRGLAFLVRRGDLESDPLIEIRFLSASWADLEKDFERAVEFDQSHLFKQIYENEFGQAGGHPFGMLVGDYAIHPRLSATHPHDDLSVLRSISGVAASAFCPFLCAADPTLLDLDSFAELEVTRDHSDRLDRLDYLKWNELRQQEDSRFVGVLLPRILMRGPYEDDGTRVDRFVFEEDVTTPGGADYLWGNPAFAYAAVAMRSFATSGWLADVRGLRQGEDGGGLVSDLPSLSFPSESPGVIPRPVTEVAVTDSLERQLSEIGLLPLCDCKDTPLAVFASGQSIHKHKQYDAPGATANAKISAMLPYMLTVSRFAHYVKIIARNKVGSYTDAETLERILSDWIMDYVTSDGEASADVKSRKPLREANIIVRPDPARPGTFRCVMQLAPHYELDEMAGTVRLRTILGSS